MALTSLRMASKAGDPWSAAAFTCSYVHPKGLLALPLGSEPNTPRKWAAEILTGATAQSGGTGGSALGWSRSRSAMTVSVGESNGGASIVFVAVVMLPLAMWRRLAAALRWAAGPRVGRRLWEHSIIEISTLDGLVVYDSLEAGHDFLSTASGGLAVCQNSGGETHEGGGGRWESNALPTCVRACARACLCVCVCVCVCVRARARARAHLRTRARESDIINRRNEMRHDRLRETSRGLCLYR
jgi:hypothetical protein